MKRSIKIKKLILSFIKTKTKKELIIYSLVFCGIMLTLVTGITYSRYIFDSVRETYFLSKEFYFTSNALNGNNYELDDWDGLNDYILTVDVKNYIDELRWTDENIPYEITITCDAKNSSGNLIGNVTCSKNDGIIMYSALNGTMNRINLTLSNSESINFTDSDYVDMFVSIKSTSPYSKTLTANYKIGVQTKNVTHQILDAVNQPYVDLILSNNSNELKEVVASWDYNALSVDNSNELVITATKRTTEYNNVLYINQIIFNIPAKTVKTIRYYKNDKTQNYTYPQGSQTSIITIS